MAEVFVAFIAMFFVALVCIAFLAIPIMIANARGICGGEHTAIVVFGFVLLPLIMAWISRRERK